MALELHGEQKIGYKRLSDADLGRIDASRQTHIGLSQSVFTYLPDKCEQDDCMLLYEDSIEHLPFYFDRILRQNGNHDSPKIRIGNEDENTIARKIREITTTHPIITNWYLIWFGLKDGRPVFILLNEQSQIYRDITTSKITFPNRATALSEKSPRFISLLQLLGKHASDIGIDPTEELQIAEELEIAVQTSDTVSKKLRAFDVNKARENCAKIGAEGESLVCKYFEGCKTRGELLDYTWVNRENESGLPYDFIIKTTKGERVYLDVKTTNYRFKQKMIFSSQEIEFATSQEHKNDSYRVYRVYKNDAGEMCLRICTNIQVLFMYIRAHMQKYEPAINAVAKIETIKYSVLPEQEELIFENEIKLK